MPPLKVAQTALLLALAASRNPLVRAALRELPRRIPAEHKQAAYRGAMAAARKAGELAGRHLPRRFL